MFSLSGTLEAKPQSAWSPDETISATIIFAEIRGFAVDMSDHFPLFNILYLHPPASLCFAMIQHTAVRRQQTL